MQIGLVRYIKYSLRIYVIHAPYFYGLMNFKKYLFIAVLLIFAGCSNRAKIFVKSFSPAIHSHCMSYIDGERGQYYTLSHSNSKRAIIFYIGGSGHSSAVYTLARFSNAFKHIDADVYMLQKRHVRKRETGLRKPSRIFIRDYHFERMVADQEYFINKVLSRDECKGRKVILLGVSEGGNIAARVASDMHIINYLAIIGSGGLPQSEEFYLFYPDKQKELSRFYDIIKRNPESVDSMAMGYSYKYWSTMLFVDPTPYFLSLNYPILLGIGENDKSVPVASARYLRSAFEKNHKSNLTYIEYKDCDHSLTDSKGNDHLSDFFIALNKLTN